MSMFMGGSWAGKRTGVIFIATGVFEILLGVFFYFMGQANAIVQSGFTFTALFLGGLGVLFILWGLKVNRKARATDAVKQMGIAGEADIVGMRQTGVVMNEINPQIELTLNVRLSDGRAPYQVTVKDFVPGMLIGRLSTGQPLPVRVDPMNTQNVVILWDQSLGGPAGMGMPGMGTPGMMGAQGMPGMGQAMVAGVPVGGAPNMADPSEVADQAALQDMREMGVAIPQMTSDQFDQVVAAQQQRIRANGIQGTGVVRNAKDLGSNINDRRLFQLETEITVSDGRPPYRIEAPAAVPGHVADRVRKGFTAPVLVDPSDPKLVVWEWDQGMAT